MKIVKLKPQSKGIWTFSKKSAFSTRVNKVGKYNRIKLSMTVIPSTRYNPEPKAPSRRDNHRMEVASRKEN